MGEEHYDITSLMFMKKMARTEEKERAIKSECGSFKYTANNCVAQGHLSPLGLLFAHVYY